MHSNKNSKKQTFTIRLIIAFAVYFVIFILPNLIGLLLVGDTTTDTTASTDVDPLFLSIVNFSIYAFIGLIFGLILYKYYWHETKHFLKRPAFNTVVAVVGWFIGLMVMYMISVIMIVVLGIEETSQNQQAIEESLKYPLLIVPTVIILAPIVEETVFRGVIFKGLSKIKLPYKLNVFLALVISSFFFGFIHISGEILAGNFGELIQILPYALLGLILAIVYYLTDSLIVPIIMHAIQNTFSILMSYLLLLLPESVTEIETALLSMSQDMTSLLPFI